MNDPGLDDAISNSVSAAARTLRHEIPRTKQPRPNASGQQTSEKQPRRQSKSAAEAFREELQHDEEEEQAGFLQPK